MSAKAIVSDPEIMGGEPCFAGTRIPVRAVKAFAVAGSTPAEIVEEYPDLTEEDVRAGLAYFAPPTEPAAALIAAAEALVDHFTGEGWADPERWMVQPAQDLLAALPASRPPPPPPGRP